MLKTITGLMAMSALVLPVHASAVDADAKKSGDKPNVVLVVIDDAGYSDFGFMGSEIETPSLDSLASESIVMSDTTVLPTCAPTRAGLMTGQDPHEVGLGSQNKVMPPGVSESTPGYKGSIEGDYQSIASLLKAAGYHTMMAGKWHLGSEETQMPHALGFDQSVALLDSAASYYNDGVAVAPVDSESGDGFATYVRNDKPLGDLPPDFYATRYYTDEILKMIQGRPDKDAPFFAYLAYTAVHDPLHAPEDLINKYIDRYEGKSFADIRQERIAGMCEKRILKKCDAAYRWMPNTPDWDSLTSTQQYDLQRRFATYAAVMDYADQQIGRVIQHLKDIGEYDNTLIMVLSDNGASPMPRSFYARGKEGASWQAQHYPNQLIKDYGKKGSFPTLGMPNAQASSGLLYGFKTTVFEGGIRSPMVIKRPGVKESKIYDYNLHITDLYPTLAEYAGIDLSDVSNLNGLSIKPFIEGVADFPEFREFGLAWMGMRAYRKGPWKLIFVPEASGGEGRYALYNLASDPGETTDLSQTNPEIFEELVAKWDAYAATNNVVKSPMEKVNGMFGKVAPAVNGIDWSK